MNCFQVEEFIGEHLSVRSVVSKLIAIRVPFIKIGGNRCEEIDLLL